MHCSQECSHARPAWLGLHDVTRRARRAGRERRGTSRRAEACAALTSFTIDQFNTGFARSRNRRTGAAPLTLFTIEQLSAGFEGPQNNSAPVTASRALTPKGAGGQFSAARPASRQTNPPGEFRTGHSEGRDSGSGTETRSSAFAGTALRPCRWRFSLNHETTVPTESVPEVSDLLTLPVAARRLSVCRRSLERLIAAGEFPRPVKVGSASRVPVTDLQAYIAKLLANRGASS